MVHASMRNQLGILYRFAYSAPVRRSTRGARTPTLVSSYAQYAHELGRACRRASCAARSLLVLSDTPPQL